MGISQITSSVLVFLTGLLPASCHRTSAEQKASAANPPAAITNAVASSFKIDLGKINLTNDNETCVAFNTGDTCTITPKLLDGKTAQLTLAFESKNDYGETKNFSVKQVMATQGRPVEVSLGNFNLSFTPTVAASE